MLLKTRGPQTAQVLASLLGLTAMGVRRQLEAAVDAGLVSYQDSPGKVGRPVRRWLLTEAGNARFPDRHAELTLDLIAGVRTLFGESGLEKLIAAREESSERAYRERIGPHATLDDKVAALAAARSLEGYMAETEPRIDGSVLLLENHCPICTAARACQQFCRSELEVFRRVLGTGVSVVRIEHQLEGRAPLRLPGQRAACLAPLGQAQAPWLAAGGHAGSVTMSERPQITAPSMPGALLPAHLPARLDARFASQFGAQYAGPFAAEGAGTDGGLALYRAIAEQLPHGALFAVDRDLRYLLARGASLREAGHEPADFEGPAAARSAAAGAGRALRT
ncbi:metalloregulator ArsR/SmtB family transcription factor [Massilia sp. Se16.2.3]|uniref:helix-turn-helix transcriptional regulator n=1 Tax=Massilia sp. Se16.2.3 TaxID=2709303 RepID=UPI001AED5743|nr:metalloregulator ArsR/SmtB family transcription factor [Massilia sp. Se16.2.3]